MKEQDKSIVIVYFQIKKAAKSESRCTIKLIANNVPSNDLTKLSSNKHKIMTA